MPSYNRYAEARDWTAETFGKPDEGDVAFYEAEITPLVRAAATQAHLLEIGFGNGRLLGWAKSKNLVVSGLEIQDVLRDRARVFGIDTLATLAEAEAASLDIVVALDVFEHISFDALAELCSEVHRILRPGGYLLARFPNGDSPFGLAIQNGDATHITALGQGAVADLMNGAGFGDYALRAPAEPARGLRAQLKATCKAVVRQLFRQFARLAYMGGSTPSTFTMNYMLVARRN